MLGGLEVRISTGGLELNPIIPTTMSTTQDPFLDEASVLPKSLSDRICEKFAKSKYGSEKEECYLPDGYLDDLITPATISEQLSNSLRSLKPPEPEQLVEFINKHAKKVFAITVLARLPDSELCLAMRRFRYYKVTNDTLPILDVAAHSAMKNPPWREWLQHLFYENQWRFLAPVFVEDELVYTLERDHILPFESKGSGPKEGTFGTVFEVEIHKDHQKSPAFMVRNCCDMVAVKTPALTLHRCMASELPSQSKKS